MERTAVSQEALQPCRQAGAIQARQLADVLQVLGSGNLRHRDLVLEARFRHLKGRGHVEDLRAVLDRDDAAAAEAAAVAGAVHLVDNRGIHVAPLQEIGVQRVHVAPLHRPARRGQRLPQHLAAENPWRADVAALPAENILLERLELEHRDQILERLVHVSHRQPAAVILYAGRRLRRARRLC